MPGGTSGGGGGARRVRVGVVLLGLAVGAVFLVLMPARQAIDVRADTEVVEFEVGREPVPRWYLPRSELVVDGEKLSPSRLEVAVEYCVHVRFERLGRGAVLISVTRRRGEEAAEPCTEDDRTTPPGDATRPMALLYLDGAGAPVAVEEEAWIKTVVPREGPLTVLMAGQLLLGDVAFPGATVPLLHHAEVRIVGRHMASPEQYVARRESLNEGDRLVVVNDGRRAGLVRAEADEPGLVVGYHAAEAEGRVERFGADPYRIRPSLWLRLRADGLLQVLAGILVIFATGLIQAFTQAVAGFIRTGRAADS